MLSEVTSLALVESVILFSNPFFSRQKERKVAFSELESFLNLSGIQNIPVIPLDWRLILALSFVLVSALTLVSQRRSTWLRRVAALGVVLNFGLLTLRRTLALWRSVALWLRILKGALMVRSSLGWLFGQRFIGVMDSVVLLKIFGASTNLTEPILGIFRKILPVRLKHIDLPLSGLMMTIDLLSSVAERQIL